MKSAAHCLTIPPDVAFLPALASWVLKEHAADLARLRIFLPNRRACRALRETFLDITGGKPLLLPHIQPIGDTEEDSLPADIAAGIALEDIPAAIAPERRLLLLARLVMQFESRRRGAHCSLPQALPLARQLARFLDDIAREGVDIQTLPSLVEDKDLSEHWQQTVEFLHIVSRAWPEVLAQEGVIDPIDRRNRLLKAMAKTWQYTPPGYPVIAAGSTGTQPATADLLAVIARLPQGRVVLPGLDKDMPNAEWDILAPTHPQYAMKQLLERIKCKRNEVETLSSAEQKEAARVRVLRTAFQPAAATAAWAKMDMPLEGLHNIKLLVADTLLDEARTVAVILRQILETPRKNAALVTPDRSLARMVAAQMDRFGVSVDDSAGQPLLDTPAGYFLRLVIEMVAFEAAPVPLLAVLRHPLARAGREPAELRRLSRFLEKEYLRGVRPAAGFVSLMKAVCYSPSPLMGEGRGGGALTKDTPLPSPPPQGGRELELLLTELETHTRTLLGWFSGKFSIAPVQLLREHLKLAEWLAGNELWAGDAATQLAECLARHLEHADVLPPIHPSSYPAFFESLLAEEVYRPRYGQHPRLHIVSPMEARLQHYDTVILSGLNEGIWPAHSPADPWMSRPMREAFGLPPLERSIGQSAHDFFQLCGAPEVFLTRARKANGSPTVPSRWLVRLETLYKGHNMAADSAYYEQAKAALDAPVELPMLTQPKPTPPTNAHPQRLSVTAVDTWLRDPYQVYARYVLGLEPLPPLDQEPGAADFGSIVHEALAQFCQAWPEQLPANAAEELLKAGRKAFAPYLNRPSVAALWWPRFEAMADWYLAQERERRQHCQVIAERKARLPIGKNFMLTARIDRLEISENGNAVIADYKTGTVPSATDIKNGMANQLPLEAWMVAEGVLEPPLPREVKVGALEYWRLAGNSEKSEIKALDHIDSLIAQSRETLETLIRDMPFAAEENPKPASRYNAYDHLTRRKEWGEV